MVSKNRANYSWAILATAFTILFFNSGSRMAFGVMLKPMQEDLHWSRSSLSLVATVFMILSALIMPIAGRLADRYGFRAVLSIATITAAVGMGLTGWVEAKWQIFLVFGVVFAIGNGASSIGLVAVLVSRWFARGRGMANSGAIAGSAIGQFVVVSVLASVLLDWGWRPSYRVLALATLASTLPLILIVLRPRPQGRGQNDASPTIPHLNTSVAHSEHSVEGNGQYTLGVALRSRSFMLLAFFYAICGFQDWLVGTHVVAFATDQGISPVVAGYLLATMGLMGLIGVLISGYFSDRFGPVRPTVMCFTLRIAVFSLIIGSDSSPAIMTFALLYGFTFLMTAPLTPIFVARHFGTRHLGSLTGSINMVHQMSGGLGAFVGGVIFDSFGGYYWAWVLALMLSVIGASTVLLLEDRRGPQMA